MEKISSLRSPEHLRKISTDGVLLSLNDPTLGKTEAHDLVYPYFILSLCLSGSAHSLYDMKEISLQKNDLSLILPGHITRPLGYSHDFTQAWLIFDPTKFMDSELKFNENDLKLLSQAPICHLTDEQAGSLLSILQIVKYIVTRTEEELPRKHRLLEAQLTLAYELYLSIRREDDLLWESNRIGNLYLQFCDLVVAHYKKERNVNYYAELLGYDARYFSKLFRAYSNGISPHEWIQNYISTQAKRLMDEHPQQTVKELTFQLGFPNTANFCRYFKKATGMTPQEYKQKNRP